MTLSPMEDVFKTLELSDDDEIFRRFTAMTECIIHNCAVFIQKIARFNLGVAFLKSVSICRK